jgi:hypothetical protein
MHCVPNDRLRSSVIFVASDSNYRHHECKACGGAFQVEAGTLGIVQCPNCNASISIFPNSGRSHDHFTFANVTAKFVTKDARRPPSVAGVDAACSMLGQQLCLEMITGQRDFALPINNYRYRNVNKEEDFHFAKEEQSREAGLALVAIPIGVVMLFTPFIVCGLAVLLAVPFTLFTVSREQSAFSSKLALATRLGGVLEQGQVHTFVPEHRLLLGFEWVDTQIHMRTCQRIPDQHMLVVNVDVSVSGSEGDTYHYHNTTFVTATDGSWVYPLMEHAGINSQEAAESALAREPWRPFLNGPVVLDRT